MCLSPRELQLLLLGLVCVTELCAVPAALQKDPKCGQKVQETSPWSYFALFTRIVGGNQAKQGSHPWQVSLKRRQKHFCGGTIVSAQWVVTAAHCTLGRNLLQYLRVTAGEHDLSLKENSEQTLPVKSVIQHPKFDPKTPMNYDIALLKLDGTFNFSSSVLPTCLPHPGEKFEAGFICTACGWGRLKENGLLPQVLYEVNLPILNSRECSRALSTLKKPIQGDTIMCAGFPDGGRDACQGDSGGPLLCRGKHGAWTLAGVISWGMGCARGWIRNEKKKHYNRGSPGIFTDLSTVLSWIQETMNADLKVKSSTVFCSVQDGKLCNSEGELHFPARPEQFYQNHQLCIWTLSVPEGNYIRLRFSHFDVEQETFCDYDSLSVYSKDDRLVGKFCGRDLPLPILIGSNSIRLKFVSDDEDYGTGFSITYKALTPDIPPDAGCESLAVLFEEGVLESMHYPEHYSNMADCQWIICAPKDHVVKLTYQYFEVEESEDCSCDAVTVYEDVGKEEEIAKFCGFALPAPVLSSSAVMLVVFHSDETETFGGFRATVSFVHVPDLDTLNSTNEDFENMDITEEEIQVTTEDACGMPSNQPRFIFSRIIGGEEAVQYSWPWQASVQIADEHICGGAVLTKEWVVTAAHCLNSREAYRDLWMVVTGLHDLTEQEYRQKRSVKQCITHPSFNETTLDSDIALLQLAEPLEFNPSVLPVCLPDKEEVLQPSRMCVVTGWGAPEADREKGKKLQQLEVPILALDVCQSYYINLPNEVTQKMICAGFPLEEGKDSCTGDSGGPLVCPSEENSGFYTLHGITSWGLGCGRKNYPGIYTNVEFFVDWIKSNINSSDLPISVV
ncbi:ovochymase-2 isoform X1 [Corvus kubaryi]|uniref:ovochymase-2 isoform X1 n=1 Tax=Corvus kubaryi TaxID=68294 RepID=UPI001C04144C|nr:ovochymase-2 isoform X1 [Corvus kubaryi]